MLNYVMTRITSKGLSRAVGVMRGELRILTAHKRGARKSGIYRQHRNLKLHFGCGPNYKRGWVNIDLSPNADLQLDLREPIPLCSGSAEIVYSEHFFEHLKYPTDALSFLTECHRLLRPSGIFSIGVPDTLWPLRDFAGVGDGDYFSACSLERWHPEWCKTPMEHINEHFRQGGEHEFAYDFETLRAALMKSGFGKVRRREFDTNLDSEKRKTGTLYVQAVRP
jgi:predicted SAM-dependent methyltransferase